MALTDSVPGVSGAADTTEFRKAMSGLVVTDTTGAPRAGIFPRHGGALLTSRTDMNVNIGAFEAAAYQFGGSILFTNDATAQLPSPLVSPLSGTNYYVVYAKINESTSPGTDPNNNRVLGTVLSTSSFTTARASGTRMDGSGTGLPVGAVEIGTVEMPTGKTATNQSGVIISNTFLCTAAAGGVVRIRNQAEQDAYAIAPGNLVYRLDLKALFEYVDGTTPGLYHIGGRPVGIAISFAGGYSASGTSPARLMDQGGRLFFEGAVTSVSTTFTAGVNTPIGSIPAASAPAEQQEFGVVANGTFCTLRVTAAGAISIIPSATYTAALALTVAGANWRNKNL